MNVPNAKCPICGKAVAPPAPGQPPSGGKRLYPFCSERCRQVDLGRWLNEEYRVPADPSEDDSEDDAEGGQRDGGSGDSE